MKTNIPGFFSRLYAVLIFLMILTPGVQAQQPLAPLTDARISAGFTQEKTLPATGLAPDATAGATVTVITQMYTYPTSISLQGDHVVGTLFGGAASYYWTPAGGLIQVPGTAYGVAESGLIGGSYSNSVIQYNGSNVETAGTCDPGTLTWTFTGMNPAVPTLFATDYNTGWDISSDGSTVVGMQWYQNYDYSAFKWTQPGGYQMIGTGVGNGSRASGISANGSVVFGWAEVPAASRTPVIWYNNQVVYVDNMAGGEAFGASPNGNFVTGTLNNDGFRWSPQGTTTFTNTLMTGQMSPTTVLNNGTVFGYITTAWPPVPTSRRAFARDSLGNMMTFNDYAAARGLENAQDWIFYSINDGTEDGNTLLGAGKNPLGQDVTFIMEFTEELPVFSADPPNIDFGPILMGTQSDFRDLKISNTGTGMLVVNGISLEGPGAAEFILNDANTYPQSLASGDSLSVSIAFAPLNSGSINATAAVSTATGTHQVPLAGYGLWEVGTGEKDSPARLHVFPVPASRSLNIENDGKLEHLRIFNTLGQQVHAQSCGVENPLHIDISGLPEGIYTLRGNTKHSMVYSATFVVRR